MANADAFPTLQQVENAPPIFAPASLSTAPIPMAPSADGAVAVAVMLLKRLPRVDAIAVVLPPGRK